VALRLGRLIRRLAWLAVLGAVAAGGVYLYVVEWWAELPNRGRGDEVVVDVPLGTGPRSLARILAAQGVVSDSTLFELYTRIRRATPRIRAGRYLVRDDLSPTQVLARVARVGAGGALRVTIPEGKNLFQIGEILEAEGITTADAFVRAAREPALLGNLRIQGDSAEGVLFPDTYDLVPGTSPSEVVRRLHVNFQRKAAPLFALHSARITELAGIGVDVRGVVTLASLVEAEARLPVERPRVAAVFLNRLARDDFQPRYLNTDPAVVYGCRVSPTRACNADAITKAMLQDADNPYNTYRRAGLPPGPICNPGLASIEAVLLPADGDELYFVARGDGSHAFASTLAEHNENVRRYR
jgi:UPF0755 protein